MAAFVDADERLFERRVASRLREFFPEEVAEKTEADLVELVRLGRSRAARYGFRSHYHASLYVGAMLQFGLSFDTALSWASDLLSNQNIEPGTKLAMIYNRIPGDEHVPS